MTASEFNEKYKDYLGEGHYGLDIHIPTVIDYLDEIFCDLIKIPGFEYQQIKLKFNMARFYFDIDFNTHRIESFIANGVENGINQLVKEWDEQHGK